MARVPSKKLLQEMDRRDIQKLCKDNNIKANLKTEALIDLLLDASNAPTTAPTPRPRTASVATRTSGRHGSGRSRGASKSSVLIHDSENEEEGEEPQDEQGGKQEEEAVAPEPDTNQTEAPVPSEPEPEPTPPLPVPATPRTRKAKEQTRLGVGRPVIAGGTGARAITKSISVPKRARVSKSIAQPVQDTIMEEESEMSPAVPSPPAESTEPETSGSKHIVDPTPNNLSNQGSLASLEAIDKRVADALRPLHTQMSSLKSEVERLKTQVAEIPELQRKVQSLTTEVETLRNSAASTSMLEGDRGKLGEDFTKKPQSQSIAPTAGVGTPGKSTPGKYGSLARSGWSGPSAIVAAKANANSRMPSVNMSGLHRVPAQVPSNSMLPSHPGFAAAVTGKRRRGSDASDITGVFEQGREDEFSETELEKRVPRPTKKRAKLELDWTSESQDLSQQASGSSQPQFTLIQEQEDTSAPRAPPFTVFSGPDEPDNSFATYIDPPPPTNHLPDFFGPSPDRPDIGAQTSTANAAENQPFGFNFLPISSTPMHSMYPMSTPSFPYPEPPTSPSPSGERTYQPFGLPLSRPRSRAHHNRPLSRQDGDGSGTVNPAALSSRLQQEPSSSDLAAGLELTSVPPRVGDNAATSGAGPAKTMYGTELEGDTRFGDFGVEGVATGFWAGGRY